MHRDSSPSWSCNIDTGDHHCFSCGFGGPFARLVATVNKSWDAGRVDEWIISRKVQDVAEGRTSKREPEEAETISAADMWKFTDPPRSALRTRGITSFNAADYGVRWNPERETWIFPVRDPSNGFGIIGWQEKGNGIFRNYPRGLEKGKTLFGLELVDESLPAVILVESPLDAIKFSDAGVFNAVASYGAAITPHQLDLISGSASRLIVAMDNDNAGRVATVKICAALTGKVDVSVFAYGQPKDAGSRKIHIPLDGRDPGDMSYGELRWGVEHATPSWRTGYRD